jgi:hypothetical protein
MDEVQQQQVFANFNLAINNSNYLCRLAENHIKCDKLIRLIENGEVDINTVLWPDTRFLFIAISIPRMLSY